MSLMSKTTTSSTPEEEGPSNIPTYLMEPEDYIRLANIDKETFKGKYTASQIPSGERFDWTTQKRLAWLERRSGIKQFDEKRKIDPLTPEEMDEYEALKQRQHMMDCPMIDGVEFEFAPGDCHWVKWDRADFICARWPELTRLDRGEMPKLWPKRKPKHLATAHESHAAKVHGVKKGKDVLVEVEGEPIENATHANQGSTTVVASKHMGTQTAR